MRPFGPSERGVAFFSFRADASDVPDASRPRSEIVSLPALRGSSFISPRVLVFLITLRPAADVPSRRTTRRLRDHTAREIYWSRPMPTVSSTAKTSFPVPTPAAVDPAAVDVGRL